MVIKRLMGPAKILTKISFFGQDSTAEGAGIESCIRLAVCGPQQSGSLLLLLPRSPTCSSPEKLVTRRKFGRCSRVPREPTDWGRWGKPEIWRRVAMVGTKNPWCPTRRLTRLATVRFSIASVFLSPYSLSDINYFLIQSSTTNTFMSRALFFFRLCIRILSYPDEFLRIL